jgi:hypothetical protein
MIDKQDDPTRIEQLNDQGSKKETTTQTPAYKRD